MNKFFTITLVTLLATTLFNCSSDDDSTKTKETPKTESTNPNPNPNPNPETTLTDGEWYIFKYEENGVDNTKTFFDGCVEKIRISFQEKNKTSLNQYIKISDTDGCDHQVLNNGEWREIKSTEKNSKMFLVNFYVKIDDTSDPDRIEEDTFVLKGDILKTTSTSINKDGIEVITTTYLKKK